MSSDPSAPKGLAAEIRSASKRVRELYLQAVENPNAFPPLDCGDRAHAELALRLEQLELGANDLVDELGAHGVRLTPKGEALAMALLKECAAARRALHDSKHVADCACSEHREKKAAKA